MNEQFKVVATQNRVHIHPRFLALLFHSFRTETNEDNFMKEASRLYRENEDEDEFTGAVGNAFNEIEDVPPAARRRLRNLAAWQLAQNFLAQYSIFLEAQKQASSGRKSSSDSPTLKPKKDPDGRQP